MEPMNLRPNELLSPDVDVIRPELDYPLITRIGEDLEDAVIPGVPPLPQTPLTYYIHREVHRLVREGDVVGRRPAPAGVGGEVWTLTPAAADRIRREAVANLSAEQAAE